MLWEHATYAKLKKGLVLLLMFGVERHAQRLNQSTSLISKPFCKTEANSVSQRRTQQQQYDTFRLRIRAYPENLLYILRSKWRFYSEANETV